MFKFLKKKTDESNFQLYKNIVGDNPNESVIDFDYEYIAGLRDDLAEEIASNEITFSPKQLDAVDNMLKKRLANDLKDLEERVQKNHSTAEYLVSVLSFLKKSAEQEPAEKWWYHWIDRVPASMLAR